MANLVIEKVRDTILRLQKERGKKNEEKKQRKDQYVILILRSNGNVLDIHNDWNWENEDRSSSLMDPDAYTFQETDPCNFVTPVDRGKNILWAAIPENQDDEVTIENVVMKNSNGNQVLRSRSYVRGNTGVVIGRVRDKGIRAGEIEEYYLSYSINGEVFVLDPIIEIHDR